MTDTSETYELLSLLKVDNKGWNVALFENEMKISAAMCAVCSSICVEPVELGCEHNYQDIYLYCNQCLHELIASNDGKCPIDNHKDPKIAPNRAMQRQISRATVICPYSTDFKVTQETKKEPEPISIPPQNKQNDNKKDIMDTMGGMNDEEAEGTPIKSIAVYQEQVYGNSQLNLRINTSSTATPTTQQCMCDWKGTFNDLIHIHLAGCTQLNNPTFTLNIQITDLQNENETLKQQIVASERESKNDKAQLKDKGLIIAALEYANAQLNEQIIGLKEEINNDIFKDEVFQNETDKGGVVLKEQREFEEHKDVTLAKEYLHLTASVVCMKYPMVQHITTEHLISEVKKYEFWQYHDKMVDIMNDELQKMKNKQQNMKKETKKKRKRKFPF